MKFNDYLKKRLNEENENESFEEFSNKINTMNDEEREEFFSQASDFINLVGILTGNKNAQLMSLMQKITHNLHKDHEKFLIKNSSEKVSEKERIKFDSLYSFVQTIDKMYDEHKNKWQ